MVTWIPPPLISWDRRPDSQHRYHPAKKRAGIFR